MRKHGCWFISQRLIDMDNIFCDLKGLRYRGNDSIIGKTVRIRRPDLFEIGRHSIIDDFAYISCGVKIGEFTHVGAQACMIGGPKAQVTIGNFCNIAPGCKIAAGQNDYRGGGLVSPAVPSEFTDRSIIDPIVIGDHALFGFNVSVLAGVRLPEGVAVGANSLLKKMVYKPWTLYAGTPARELGPRDGTKMKEQVETLKESLKNEFMGFL